MPIRYLSTDDLDADQSWRLVEWCLANGAEEIGLTLMSLQGHPAPFCDRVEAALASFQIPNAPRPHSVTYQGQADIRPAQLWTATLASLAALRPFFADGLFTYLTSPHEEGWVEDPTLYRDGEIMLGVVSHEGEGFLHLSALEVAGLASLGIPMRDTGTRI